MDELKWVAGGVLIVVVVAGFIWYWLVKSISNSL